MKEIAITNEKQILTGIKKAFDAMESSKKSYVYSVIELGEKLIEAKIKAGHGNWEKFCESSLKSALGGRISSSRQALKYMEVAENKLLVLEYFSDENSVNNLTKAISDASPEQLEKVKQLEAEEEQKRLAAEAEKLAKAEAKKQPEITEGEFIEVKPKVGQKEEVKTGFVQIDAKELEKIEDNMHELASLNKSISKDNDSMERVFNANDQLSAAAKEIRRLNGLNTSLEGRLNGFMVERNALIKEAKYWRSRFEKLEKQLGGENVKLTA